MLQDFTKHYFLFKNGIFFFHLWWHSAGSKCSVKYSGIPIFLVQLFFRTAEKAKPKKEKAFSTRCSKVKKHLSWTWRVADIYHIFQKVNLLQSQPKEWQMLKRKNNPQAASGQLNHPLDSPNQGVDLLTHTFKQQLLRLGQGRHPHRAGRYITIQRICVLLKLKCRSRKVTHGIANRHRGVGN